MKRPTNMPLLLALFLAGFSLNCVSNSNEDTADAGGGTSAVDAGPIGSASDAGSAEQTTDAGPVDQASDAGPADQTTDAGSAEQATDAGPVDQATDAGPSQNGNDAGETRDAGANGDGGPAVDAGLGQSDAGSCRTPADCTNTNAIFAGCAVPDPIAFPRAACGICGPEMDQCATDTDCGSGMVCRGEGGCGCGQAALICVAGCSSSGDCLTGQTCNAESHCVQTTCTDATQCPSQFGCNVGGICERISCNADSDCQAGACVQSLCFDSLGTCFENIPPP